MPPPTNQSVFSVLFRWARRQGENFTTEAFAWLLRLLLRSEPTAGEGLISLLCLGKRDTHLLAADHIVVTTQKVTRAGKPDISISTDSFLAYVEVKTGATLGVNQLGRYRRALEEERGQRRGELVLLTVDYVEIADEDSAHVRKVRWHEVDRWLSDLDLGDGVTQFAVKEFIAFMKENVMTVQRVGWEYVKGVQAMRRLMAMLARALEAAGVRIHQRAQPGGTGSATTWGVTRLYGQGSGTTPRNRWFSVSISPTRLTKLFSRLSGGANGKTGSRSSCWSWTPKRRTSSLGRPTASWRI